MSVMPSHWSNVSFAGELHSRPISTHQALSGMPEDPNLVDCQQFALH